MQRHVPFGPYEKYFKRPLDFLCGLATVILFSWLFLLLMLLGFVFLRGNPFFIQERPGKGEKIFKLIKFRTMDNRKDQYGNLLPDALRLNKYGRMLRKTSLDELPEVFNILKGDMSVVGPRPLLVQYLPWYTEQEKHRHDVRPGLTGYAQVHGRNFVQWEKRFELDVNYVNSISLKKDFQVILDTIKIVLKHTGVGVDILMDFDAYRKGDKNYTFRNGIGGVTPIHQIDSNLWVKREDFIPFSFGGNKARKAALYFDEFDRGNYDCIVTYGSSFSNHCRIIANAAASRGVPCTIVFPSEHNEQTYNSKLLELLGARIVKVPVNEVHTKIEHEIESLRAQGRKPYFIQGGGHGNIGTKAYVDCYEEIVAWEKEHHIKFDYIFFASGTGTTQAGFVCGQILHHDDRKIVGISIARTLPKGRSIIIDSIKEYIGDLCNDEEIERNTIFVDDYVQGGYSKKSEEIRKTIDEAMRLYGLPLDETYTGKAFYGMQEYLKKHDITHKNILFIHTGGTPLFFNSL